MTESLVAALRAELGPCSGDGSWCEQHRSNRDIDNWDEPCEVVQLVDRIVERVTSQAPGPLTDEVPT